MRKVIIVLFVLSLAVIFLLSSRHLNKQNDIDFLESISLKTEAFTTNHKELYYFSNSKDQELFFKTQFVFAPKLVIKKSFDEISESEIILVVLDKQNESTHLPINTTLKSLDTIFFDENNYFKLILLKK